MKKIFIALLLVALSTSAFAKKRVVRDTPIAPAATYSYEVAVFAVDLDESTIKVAYYDLDKAGGRLGEAKVLRFNLEDSAAAIGRATSISGGSKVTGAMEEALLESVMSALGATGTVQQ